MENKHKNYNVRITDTAWEQMLEHARFLANVSADAASRLVAVIRCFRTQIPKYDDASKKHFQRCFFIIGIS